jgi:hypothetical protein
MTAAVNNLTEQADFQKNYQTLLRHYGLERRKIQTGQTNENGCEQAPAITDVPIPEVTLSSFDQLLSLGGVQ